MKREIVLITGTSTGFGLLASLELAQNGYFVIATMRDLRKADLLKEEAAKMNLLEKIELVEMDVINQAQIEEVRRDIQTRYGKLDILINNAGYSLGGLTEYLETEDWKAQLETNLFGVISVTKAFLPLMRHHRGGKIINLGSISGRLGFPGLGPYVTSKFALSGFSESLRLELLPFNLHVSLIEAGSFKTEIWEKGLSNVAVIEDEDYTYIKNIHQAATKTAENASNPKEVIRTILHICRAKKPRFRYQVGKGVKKIIFLKSVLPWSVIEWAIKRKLLNR
ncbi:SDR family oxidoreductase [Halalkalibacter alkalisediminis]|uniref:SDR family oxidoreductase n=1 Tax=Halalkalibacter alkalisediminis TaxID=935616 RepID=A0ABV6NFN4_9BACI|nr:SDR family oxidoreductase [Halalkalibacter alkalisediminis]